MEARHDPSATRPRHRYRPLVALAVAALLALSPARAQEPSEPLPPPAGEVLLVVDGAIERPNVGAEARLDRSHLARLPRARFRTTAPWFEGSQEFEGVLLRSLLEAVGATTTRFRATGLDDYSVIFEGVDLERYPVIVADTHEGEPLTVRRLGPLWIMFPFEEHPELLTQTNTAMAVWQLIRMEVH